MASKKQINATTLPAEVAWFLYSLQGKRVYDGLRADRVADLASPSMDAEGTLPKRPPRALAWSTEPSGQIVEDPLARGRGLYAVGTFALIPAGLLSLVVLAEMCFDMVGGEETTSIWLVHVRVARAAFNPDVIAVSGHTYLTMKEAEALPELEQRALSCVIPRGVLAQVVDAFMATSAYPSAAANRIRAAADIVQAFERLHADMRRALARSEILVPRDLPGADGSSADYLNELAESWWPHQREALEALRPDVGLVDLITGAADHAIDPPLRGGILSIACAGGKTMLGLYWLLTQGGGVYIVPKISDVESVVETYAALREMCPVMTARLLGDRFGREARVVGWTDRKGWDVRVAGGLDNIDILVLPITTLAARIDSPMYAATHKGEMYGENLLHALRTRYSATVYDEAHHMAAATYRSSLALLSGARLGLTATLQRGDYGQNVAVNRIGPVRYRHDVPEVPATVYAVRVNNYIRPEHTTSKLWETDPNAVVLGIPERCDALYDIVLATHLQLRQAGGDGTVLVVSSSQRIVHKDFLGGFVAHLRGNHSGAELIPSTEDLKMARYPTDGLGAPLLAGARLRMAVLHGGSDSNAATRAWQLRNADIAFATLGVVAENMNAPRVGAIVFATTVPHNPGGSPLLRQTIGRAQRKGRLGKRAMVVVLEDGIPRYVPHIRAIKRWADDLSYKVHTVTPPVRGVRHSNGDITIHFDHDLSARAIGMGDVWPE